MNNQKVTVGRLLLTRSYSQNFTEHQEVFNLSESDGQVLKCYENIKHFSWSSKLAPNVQKICEICKCVDNWISDDSNNVAVICTRGNNDHLGVFVSAYMIYKNNFNNNDPYLDIVMMKRFIVENVNYIKLPSSLRYIDYFQDLLLGNIKVNYGPIYLNKIIMTGTPKFQSVNKGVFGCRMFLKIYEKQKVIFTSGIYVLKGENKNCVINVMDKDGSNLKLQGDITIKCYHRYKQSEEDVGHARNGRECIFSLQFNTFAVTKTVVIFKRYDLDMANYDPRFPPNGKVEFQFSFKKQKMLDDFYDNIIFGDPVTIYDSMESLITLCQKDNFSLGNYSESSQLSSSNNEEKYQKLQDLLHDMLQDVRNNNNFNFNKSNFRSASCKTECENNQTTSISNNDENQSSNTNNAKDLKKNIIVEKNSSLSKDFTDLKFENCRDEICDKSLFPLAENGNVPPYLEYNSTQQFNDGSDLINKSENKNEMSWLQKQQIKLHEKKRMLQKNENYINKINLIKELKSFQNKRNESHLAQVKCDTNLKKTDDFYHTTTDHRLRNDFITPLHVNTSKSSNMTDFEYNTSSSDTNDSGLLSMIEQDSVLNYLNRSEQSLTADESISALKIHRQDQQIRLQDIFAKASSPREKYLHFPVLEKNSNQVENSYIQNYSKPYFTLGELSQKFDNTLKLRNEVHQEINSHVPNFVHDTSKYWYKPAITREEAISLLRNRKPGSFLVRNSNSYCGAFGLALKVSTIPNLTKDTLDNETSKKVHEPDEYIRHYLIEPTKLGVRLKGCPNEPVFTSLSSFIYQHAITKLALPQLLVFPDSDITVTKIATCGPNSLLDGASCYVHYLLSLDTESLTGPEAIRKAMFQLLNSESMQKEIVVHFKVSKDGITVTDYNRLVFFRKHFSMSMISYVGMDPDNHRWSCDSNKNLKSETIKYNSIKKTLNAFIRQTIVLNSFLQTNYNSQKPTNVIK